MTRQRVLKVRAAVVPMFTKSAFVVIWLTVGLFVVVRLWRLTTYSLRADEISALRRVSHDWIGTFLAIVRDVVHPPLFYVLLKVWIGIGGESEFWLRLFPVLTAFAAIGPFFLLCRELGLRSAEINLALMLMAVNGYLIYYAQEIRMYSLLLFLTLCSLWLFARFFNAPGRAVKQLIALSAVNLLLVYTQYYGWIVIGVESIFLLFLGRDKLPWFLLSVAAVMLCFSPWAYVVARVAVRRPGGLGPNISSFSRPGLGDLGGYYATLTGFLGPGWKAILGQTLFAYPILLWAWRIYRGTAADGKREAVTFWWLLLLSLLPVVFSYLVSQVLPQSVWGTRFLIIAAAPYIVLVAFAVHRLHPGWLRSATVLSIVVWAALAGFRELNNTGKHAWEPLVYRMIRAETSQAKGIVVYAFGSSDEIIRFYLEKVNEKRFQTKRIFTFDKVEGDHFWVASRSREESPQQLLRNKGYQVGEGFSDGFGGLLFPVWRR
jgi:uncharacterized membrane protein